MKCGKTGKVIHKSQTNAVRTMVRLKNAGLSSYYCGHCRGWHIGNSRNFAKVQARIDQLLGKGT